jgi:hypothetical protein
MAPLSSRGNRHALPFFGRFELKPPGAPAPQAYRQKLSGGLSQSQSYFGGGPDHSFLAFYLSNLGPAFYNFLLDHI